MQMKSFMRLFYPILLLFISSTLPLTAQHYEEWVDRSASYIEDDMLDSAAVALQKAMSLDPVNENNPLLLLNLGIIQRELRRYEDAYISFTAAIANNPMPGEVLHRRASLLSEMERFDEAIEDYTSLIRLFPDEVEAYYRRGVLYLERDERKMAEADFNRSHQIDSLHQFTRLSKALMYKLDGQWPAAERIYTDLIALASSPDPALYLSRAECYVYMGETLHASADLRALESSQSDNPYFYFLRGRVRLEQFDKAAARADFRRAEEMGYDAGIVDEWLKKTDQ